MSGALTASLVLLSALGQAYIETSSSCPILSCLPEVLHAARDLTALREQQYGLGTVRESGMVDPLIHFAYSHVVLRNLKLGKGRRLGVLLALNAPFDAKLALRSLNCEIL